MNLQRVKKLVSSLKELYFTSVGNISSRQWDEKRRKEVNLESEIKDLLYPLLEDEASKLTKYLTSKIGSGKTDIFRYLTYKNS